MALKLIFATPLRLVGQRAIDITRELGGVALFFFNGLILIFSMRAFYKKTLQQVYFIGSKSI